jgi:polyisoprenoid-binding protein YceI
MRRLLPLLLLIAAPLTAEMTRYVIRPTYSSVRFSIVKWGVIKDEGLFRDFTGTLDYDPAHPERSRVDVVVQASSLDTKNDVRDETVRSEDFLHVARYPTLEFHATGVTGNRVSGALTIHGVTRRIEFPVTALGVRDIPDVGRLAGFETSFVINRRAFGVLGARWGAVPGVLSDEVEVHIIIGAIRPARR